ncbi:MAG: diguanylate cyclase [Isosphaeraceae bacterium]
MNVLIADDDRVATLRLRRVLEKLGHKVTVAVDGREAWLKISGQRPQVLISDWMMPSMDGPELCRRVRAIQEGPYVYVILLTSRDTREDRVNGLESGADDFLVKPVDPSELVARLSVAKRILTMLQELEEQSIRLQEMYALLQRQNAQLAEQAITDGLTGLVNHRHFQASLAEACSLCRREKVPVTLVMLDVDHFKSYNDSYGHPAGDEVLRRVAGLLWSSVRQHDVVARYGGEEFAVLLLGADESKGRLSAERILRTIEGHPWPLRPVTVSVGVSTFDPTTQTPESLVEAADRALYESKRNGRNRVTSDRDPLAVADPR